MYKKLWFLILGALFSLQVTAEDLCKDNYARMEVVGTGIVEAYPDEATLTFTMEKQAKTADAVRVEVDRNVAEFLGRLAKLGVKESQIRADSNRITAVYRHDSNGNSSLQGYQGTRQVRIKTEDFTTIGPITDAAMQSGLNGILGYQYGLKNEAEYKVKAQLKAIEDAKAQAARLSEGFGFQIKGICSVHFNDVSMPSFRAQPAMLANTMLRAAAKGEANVSEHAYAQDKLTVQAQVNVSYCLQ